MKINDRYEILKAAGLAKEDKINSFPIKPTPQQIIQALLEQRNG